MIYLSAVLGIIHFWWKVKADHLEPDRVDVRADGFGAVERDGASKDERAVTQAVRRSAARASSSANAPGITKNPAARLALRMNWRRFIARRFQ